MRSAGDAAGRYSRKVGLVAAAFGALVAAPALKAYAKLESLQVSFESMLGSSEEAADMIKELTEFSAKTPFQIEGIGRATKMLLAFGVEGDKITDKLQFLGDIASGAGVPIQDLAQIYGKSMAKNKAQTEELNQMAERGIPILEALVELAASYGHEISKEDVYKAAEKGQITFKAVEEALKLMTAEGGIFNKQMVKQSETMSGLASTVKDNVFLAFAELGKQIEETFKIKDQMRAFIGWLQNLTGELKKPREEQEGFARAVSETLRGMKAVKDFLTPEPGGDARANAYARAGSKLGNFAPPSLFDPKGPREEQKGFVRAITEALRDMKADVVPEPPPSLFAPAVVPEPPPSLFAPSAAAGGDARGGKAEITVDFKNMPRGTRTEIRNLGTNLDVNTGFAMQTAM